MTVKLALGLLLALASAATLNWGYVVQHGETAQMPPLSLRQPLASLRSLFTNLRWLAGFLAGIGGWVLYVGALAFAPLSLVQAASAGGIGLLALLVWKTTGTNLARREWIGVAIAVGGLALLGISLAGERPGGGHGSWLAVGAWMALSLLAAALAVGPGARLLTTGAGFGVAAGVLYAAGDVGTKAVVGGGVWLIVIPAVLAFHGLAFVALQFGFQRGGALATAGVATLFTNALPILAGVVVYHELLPTGILGVLRVVAFAAVILGAAVLARGASSSPPPAAAAAGRPSLSDTNEPGLGAEQSEFSYVPQPVAVPFA